MSVGGKDGLVRALAARLSGPDRVVPSPGTVELVKPIHVRWPAHYRTTLTHTVPIVFATGSDPITEGLVASLNRPGANVTGVSLSGIGSETA
jgi:hypothetical protein